jgi:methyltransferase-like protein 6/tocopherol cyclase
VTAATVTHEVEVSGWIAPGDDAVGGTTVLRAPTDDAAAGMAPLCRESFKGTVRVSLWERDAAATWEGSGGGGGTAGWSGGGKVGRGRCILDAVESDTAAVEVGGGPWHEEGWSGNAEMREPLGSLAGAPVDVDAIAGFFKRVGVDIVPGL